jgi:hypothetical protein
MGDAAKNNNVIQDRFPKKREEIIAKRTNVEKLIMFYQGKIPNARLSPRMLEYEAKIKATSDLIAKHGSVKAVLPILMARYEISTTTAKRLYDEAQLAYGSMVKLNRPMWIDTYMGMLLKGIEGAKNDGDWKSYANMTKDLKDAIEKFMGTDDAEVYQKIQIPDFKLGYFPEELKVKREPNWEAKLAKLKEDKYREIEEAIVIHPDEEDTL